MNQQHTLCLLYCTPYFQHSSPPHPFIFQLMWKSVMSVICTYFQGNGDPRLLNLCNVVSPRIAFILWQAYLEFFTCREVVDILLEVLKEYPQVNYHVVNREVRYAIQCSSFYVGFSFSIIYKVIREVCWCSAHVHVTLSMRYVCSSREKLAG